MKTLLIAFALVLTTSLTTKAQVYLQGGLNLANISKTDDGQVEKNNVLPTFNAGIMGRFGLSEVFDLESGVLVSGRGSKAETYFNGGNDYVKSKFHPIYIEVPLNAVVKIPVTKGAGLFFHAGPYAAIGVAGKASRESKVGPLMSTSSSSIEFSNDDPFTSEQEDAAYNKLKRFDFGLNMGGGIEFKSIILKANFGLGLTKINSTESNNEVNDRNKYRTVSFSVGIPIGKL
jgi:Outer membrane protein beta-barrel domain